MLLSFFLLFFLCESTVNSFSTIWPPTTTTTYDTSTEIPTTAKEEMLSPLQLVAIPDYPVAAGQRVYLHCSASTVPNSVVWSWQRLKNGTWHEEGSDRDLTLTEPEQSGLYHCRAKSRLSQRVSSHHTVFIISMHATVPGNLGIAAIFLSLLALFINFAILCWLGWQRLTPSNTAAKDFPAPEKSQKGGLPQTEIEGDVYMNYTNTSQAYTDLDPTSVTEDNVYSSLS